MRGCYIFEDLLQWTLTCFYNQSCINELMVEEWITILLNATIIGLLGNQKIITTKMSDDDDMGGNDDFDLDYENTDEEPDADLENQYYNSKALKEDDPLGAIESFKKVLALEQ
ncbi:unnamed protein product, partial [Adineta steineri]